MWRVINFRSLRSSPLSWLSCLLKASVAYSYLEFLMLTHVAFRMMESLLQVAVRNREVCCKLQFHVVVSKSVVQEMRWTKWLRFESSIFVLLLIFLFEYRSLECSDFDAQCIWKSRTSIFSKSQLRYQGVSNKSDEQYNGPLSLL